MDDRIKELILKLTEKTSVGALNWGKTSRDNEYICDLGDTAITVDRYWSGDDWGNEEEVVVDICILNREGKQIDRYYYTEEPTEAFRILAALHSAAHRRHYKIDEIIDAVSAKLDSL